MKTSRSRHLKFLLAGVLSLYAHSALATITVAKTFTGDNIPTNGSSTLGIKFSTPAGGTTNLAVSDAFPTTPGIFAVAATPGITNTCAGSLTNGSGGALAAGDTSLKLSGGTIPVAAGTASCSLGVKVTANTAGAYVNTTGTTTGTTPASLPDTGAPASATLWAYDPPIITKTITPSQVNLFGTATATYTITNPATNPGSFTSLAFGEVYATPGVVRVNRSNAVPGYTSSGCGAATITVSSGANSTLYSGGTLAPGQTCTITVILTGVATLTSTKVSTGSTNITFGSVTSNVATLLVTPLNVTKTFPAANGTGTDNNVQTNATTNLAIKLSTATALNSLTITDTFPTTPGAMTVADSTVSNTCGGTITDDGGRR